MTLLDRLKALRPLIEQICSISGTPGVSIGVLHHGQILYLESFGYRDVGKKLRPDENTIYYIASLSKAFTAAALGTLVEDHKLQWNQQVRTILPDFTQINQTVYQDANMEDFMSHRTGLAPKNSIWLVEDGKTAFGHSQTLRTIDYLEKISEFRSRFEYNNWGYALADIVIERLTGESWGELLKDRILQPLGMERTITEHDTKLDNVAEAYMALANGQPYHVPRPNLSNGSLMEGAVGVQSNVKDLLQFYGVLMASIKDQRERGTTSTPNSPFKQVSMLWEPHVPMSTEPSSKMGQYCVGWIATDLPGQLSGVGLNGMYIDEPPTVGKGMSKSRRVYHHQGSLVSFLSAVHLLPDTNTAIVVLTNAMARNDAADWLCEMLLEAVLDNPEKNDYVALAHKSAEASVRLWKKLAADLEGRRDVGTKSRDLREYVGKYYNYPANFYLDVFMKDSSLYFCRQGARSQSYLLDHYNYDVYSWLLTRDEDVRRGLFPTTFPLYYLLKFKANSSNEIDRVVWTHDPTVAAGESFLKAGVEGLQPPSSTG